MKLLGRVTAAILCGLVLGIVSVSAQGNWPGTYEYTEVGGRNAGGAAMVVTHELKVFKIAGGLGATLESNGYQTSINLNCTVKVDRERLMLYFDSYGPDNMFETNEKGDLLLTLVRRPVRGKAAILTYWGKFSPVVLSRVKSGKIYFTRSK
ncbi:MAG: DUF5991 domain-containing protein [Acidobacteriota bacterium]